MARHTGAHLRGVRRVWRTWGGGIRRRETWVARGGTRVGRMDGERKEWKEADGRMEMETGVGGRGRNRRREDGGGRGSLD